MNIKKLINIIFSEFSYKEAYGHMFFLVEEVGERLAGSSQLLKAAQYINNKLSQYGLNSRIDEFYIYTSFPVTSELKVLSPEQLIIESFPKLTQPINST